MFRKNVSGQHVCIAAINASTGAALAGASISVRRCIDGTFAAATGTVTEDSGGLYKFALSQADTNGNNVSLYFTATSMVPVSLTFVTTAADPTDSVRFGLTGLANAAPGSAGGLAIVGSEMTLSSGEHDSIATAFLKLDWSGITGEAARSMLNAMRFIRNKWSTSGSTLTVCKEDDSTTAWTATVSTTPGADPITGNDPA